MSGGLHSIDDADDPRVADYRDVRDRDLAGRDGLFMAEGVVVVRSLLSPASRFRARSLLLAANKAPGLGALIAAAKAAAVPVYVAEPAVMDAIAGFPIHRGVLAVGERGEAATPRSVLTQGRSGLVLAASGVGNHDNIGALFRNAAAFGADAVLLDRQCCDPLYRKALRVSVGAALTLPFAWVDDGHALIDALEAAGCEAVALSPAGVERLSDVAPGGRRALVVGAEGPGLAADVMARCRTVRIPMAEGFDSLNVATAAAVALHHLSGM